MLKSLTVNPYKRLYSKNESFSWEMAPHVVNVCCSLQSWAPFLESGVEANYVMWDLAICMLAMYNAMAHFLDTPIDESYMGKREKYTM